jgi:hypothetical protein
MRLSNQLHGLPLLRIACLVSAVLIAGLDVPASPICDCFEYPSHRAEFGKAKAVFVGEVVKIDKTTDPPTALASEVSYAVTFRLEQRWKGAQDSKIIVWIHATHELCARWQFQQGVKYLVYATSYHGNLMMSGWCSRTRLLETNDATALREFKELDGLKRR